jgi:hypothetical protein
MRLMLLWLLLMLLHLLLLLQFSLLLTLTATGVHAPCCVCRGTGCGAGARQLAPEVELMRHRRPSAAGSAAISSATAAATAVAAGAGKAAAVRVGREQRGRDCWGEGTAAQGWNPRRPGHNAGNSSFHATSSTALHAHQRGRSATSARGAPVAVQRSSRARQRGGGPPSRVLSGSGSVDGLPQRPLQGAKARRAAASPRLHRSQGALEAGVQGGQVAQAARVRGLRGGQSRLLPCVAVCSS